MTGPSANGSENGRPTSMMSAPAAAVATNAATKSLGVGKPAVRYAISAARPSAFVFRQHPASWVRESDKVFLDLDAVLERVGDFDDRSRIRAVFLQGQVREESGVQQTTVGCRDHPDDGPVHVRRVRVGRMDDGHFVGVENDAG